MIREFDLTNVKKIMLSSNLTFAKPLGFSGGKITVEASDEFVAEVINGGILTIASSTSLSLTIGAPSTIVVDFY